MSTLIQNNRLLQISTPMGQGESELILVNAIAEEALSSLFSCTLDLFSNDINITPVQLIGRNITFWIKTNQEPTPRYFNGIVSKFTAGSLRFRGGRNYRIELVPTLWLLTKTADCKIFQNLSVVEIIQNILDQFGITNYDVSKLTSTYEPREYCVQYRETAFDFISRLMQEVGIFYYFTHADGDHTLVLADNISAYINCVDDSIRYAIGGPSQNILSQWQHEYQLTSGRWTQTDYNFETPSTSLMTTCSSEVTTASAACEIYDHPGNYTSLMSGNDSTALRMKIVEAHYENVVAAGFYSNFFPGLRFNLSEHTISNEQASYVITEITHRATDTTQIIGQGEKLCYENKFVCIPATNAYRPLRTLNKPYIHSMQTAVVVGPASEEIYTDQYGRIKVQFHWDRLGENNENSSCWIRLAQIWAGNNWGAQFIPRIGQEVIVSFLEGDPDQPIIIGSLYNSAQMPPYPLPERQTRSGIRSHSTKEGGLAANELYFEDAKDSELIYLHAEKDLQTIVENDDALTVGNNQTIEIKNNRTETIIEGDESVTIQKGNRNVQLDIGSDSLTLKEGNQNTLVEAGSSRIEAMESIELCVGENSILINQAGITITGLIIAVTGEMSVDIDSEGTVNIIGSIITIN